MRVDRAVLFVAASVVLSAVSWAARWNVATVGIGAPTKNGDYHLIINYVNAAGKEKELDVVVSVTTSDSAGTKRDNLLTALQTMLTNNNITAFTAAGPGTTSITLTSGAAPTKILNIQGNDETAQANTYTINKQSTSDKHEAGDLLAVGPGGAHGGGTVLVSILSGSASVTTTSGMLGSTIVSSLASQLVAAGVPNVSTHGPLLTIGDIPSGVPLTVANTDTAITVHAVVGEKVSLPIPALPPAFLVLLVALALGGSALILHRRNYA